MNSEFIEDPADVEETIDLVRTILGEGKGAFPEHLLGNITAALSNRATHGDMMRQLLKMCSVCPDDFGPRMCFVDGRLLYRVNGSRSFVWGSKEYKSQDGYTIAARIPIQFVAGLPCWVEVTEAREGRTERVVWKGLLGPSYPYQAIQRLYDCGGVPCHAVNHQAEGPDGYVGFVVVGEIEGERFSEVEHLSIADGKPLYTASLFGKQRRLVWGTETLCEGQYISKPVAAKGVPYVVVTSADGMQTLWIGSRPFETEARISGPSIVNGQLAYAMSQTPTIDPCTLVYIEDTMINEYAGLVEDWWVDVKQGDNTFVVFTLRDGNDWAVYANKVFLSNKAPAPNGIRLQDDGATLSIQFGGEHEPKLFDLRALGVIPAESPSA